MNLSEKKQIQNHLIEYLRSENPTLQFNKKNNLIQCPICKKDEPTANIYLDDLTKIHCFNPECKFSGDIFALVRKTLKPFFASTDEKISAFLKHKLKITIKDEISTLLTKYEDAGFHLFPLAPKSKKPQGGFKWKENSVSNKKIWLDWLDRECGLALKCGKESRIIALDIDDESAYEQVKDLLGNTLTQTTARGHHYIYEYEDCYDNINHQNMRSQGFEGELRCNNAYVVIAPTSVEGETRSWNNEKIQKMPEELKKYLFDKLKDSIKEPTPDEEIQNCIDTEKLDVVDLSGNRNSTFVKMTGIFSKWMPRDTAFKVLSFISNNLIDKPIPRSELYAMMEQVKRYRTCDKEQLAKVVLERLDIIKEGSAFQIASTLKQEQSNIEEVLKYLEDQEKVVRLQTGRYRRLNKVEWDQAFDKIGVPIDFEVPYFHDYAHFDKGNMIILGAPTGTGKTHITANIIKKLVDQKIHPYLISTEAGSKIGKIASKIGLEVGDFSYKLVKNPTEIELEDDSVTIIDWLKPEDGNFAKTDKTFEKLNDQLMKHNGFLIVFVQVRKDGTFFAPDQIDFYSALTARYSYNNAGKNADNENTFFETTKIRDSRSGMQYIRIPTKFDKETKLLNLVK